MKRIWVQGQIAPTCCYFRQVRSAEPPLRTHAGHDQDSPRLTESAISRQPAPNDPNPIQWPVSFRSKKSVQIYEICGWQESPPRTPRPPCNTPSRRSIPASRPNHSKAQAKLVSYTPLHRFPLPIWRPTNVSFCFTGCTIQSQNSPDEPNRPSRPLRDQSHPCESASSPIPRHGANKLVILSSATRLRG